MPGVLTVREEGEARRHVFDTQAVVGRDPECDVSLASRSVSRRHAILEKTTLGWTLRDLASANGTFLAGVRVTESSLAPGAAVRFGDVEAVFEIVGRETASGERLLSSLSASLSIPLAVPPARKARPVAVFVATAAGILVLAAATIWARYCDRAPGKTDLHAPPAASADAVSAS